MNTTQGIRRALQINPNGLATMFGDRRRTWREIGERVSRLAAGLRALGANPGERVAVLSLNSDRYLELYLATAWAGAVIVPLNIRWSPLENEDALRDCRACVLVVDKTFASTGTGLAKSDPGLPEWRATKRCWREASRCRTPCAPAPISPASSTPAAPPAAPKG
jgi:long-chain acyl-CoA synthetase